MQPLELKISLEGSTGATFVPGARVAGVVTLATPAAVSAAGSTVRVARLGVQIAGVLTADPKWTRLPPATPAPVALFFALGAHERLLFASPPLVLARDASVTPGAAVACPFALRLPPLLPPSFRGSALKFSYFVVAAVGPKGRAATAAKRRTLAAPLHVVAPRAVAERCDWPVAVIDHAFEAAVGSAAAAERRSERDEVERVFAEVAAIFERIARPVCVSVADASVHVVRIAMRRTVFCPGESVEGACDMSCTPLGTLVHSFRVALETEEVLEPEYCWDQRSRRPSPRVVAEQHVVAHSCEVAPFALPLPHDACHGFSSTEVTVRWLLSFLFRVVREGCHPNGPATLPPPHEVRFALPIHVLATSVPDQPLHSSSVSRCVHI